MPFFSFVHELFCAVLEASFNRRTCRQRVVHNVVTRFDEKVFALLGHAVPFLQGLNFYTVDVVIVFSGGAVQGRGHLMPVLRFAEGDYYQARNQACKHHPVVHDEKVCS